MSINTLSLGDIAAGRPPLLPNETVLAGPHCADVALKVPASLTGPKRTQNAAGQIWVTDHRVVLISEARMPPSQSSSYDTSPYLSSVVIPYTSLQSTTYNLPLFSPNNITLQFQPDPSVPLEQTNLPNPGRGGNIEAKIIVGEGAGHALWKRIEGERERWVGIRRDEENLPVYSAGQKAGETRLL